jgi:hypothetical protein
LLRLLLVAGALLLPIALPAASADGVYAPLWTYNGTWQVTRKDQAAGSKPDRLLNQCALVGQYFTCQQTVNGVVSALTIFVPANAPGKFYTQSVKPDGRAEGRGDVAIEADKWTFSSNWNQGGGKTTYYRTINTFTGKDRIHFEQQESSDRRDWKTTNSGDEVRIGPGRMTIAR